MDDPSTRNRATAGRRLRGDKCRGMSEKVSTASVSRLSHASWTLSVLSGLSGHPGFAGRRAGRNRTFSWPHRSSCRVTNLTRSECRDGPKYLSAGPYRVRACFYGRFAIVATGRSGGALPRRATSSRRPALARRCRHARRPRASVGNTSAKEPGRTDVAQSASGEQRVRNRGALRIGMRAAKHEFACSDSRSAMESLDNSIVDGQSTIVEETSERELVVDEVA